MRAVKRVEGRAVVLDRPDIDTDQIIPASWLKRVERTGFGPGLFGAWRADPDFVLSQPGADEAKVLIAGPNFGCGSSREHAVWALTDFGFKAAIATSFADIFRNNSLKNGFLPIILKPEEVDAVFAAIKRHDGYELTIDLPAQTVSDKFGWSARFDIDPFPKKCFIEGLDDVALTLTHDKEIAAYEKSHPAPYRL